MPNGSRVQIKDKDNLHYGHFGNIKMYRKPQGSIRDPMQGILLDNGLVCWCRDSQITYLKGS